MQAKTSSVQLGDQFAKEANHVGWFAEVLAMARLVLLALLALVIAAFATFLDDDDYLRIPTMLKGPGDHYLHFASFFLLTLVSLVGRAQISAILAALLLFAGFLEIAQVFIPYRGANLGDLGYSMLGILASCLVVFLFELALPKLRRKTANRSI